MKKVEMQKQAPQLFFFSTKSIGQNRPILQKKNSKFLSIWLIYRLIAPLFEFIPCESLARNFT